MGKKKNNKKKKETNLKEPKPEPKLKYRRRYWIGAGFASLALLAFGTGAFYYRGALKENTTQQQTNYKSVKDAWGPLYNEEGIESDGDFLLQYDIFKRRAKMKDLPEDAAEDLESKLTAETEQEYKRLMKKATPENYTEGAFYTFLLLSANFDSYLHDPEKIASIFNLREHPLFQELVNNMHLLKDDKSLSQKILSAAILITHQRLENTKTKGDSLSLFFQNIEKGVGDCTDYTHAAAGLYYSICCTIGRQDLTSKIRVALGGTIRKNWEFGEGSGHSWIQYEDNGHWINFEINKSDKIERDTSINLRDTPALYQFESINGSYTVTLMTTRVFYEGNKGKLYRRIHILPRK